MRLPLVNPLPLATSGFAQPASFDGAKCFFANSVRRESLPDKVSGG